MVEFLCKSIYLKAKQYLNLFSFLNLLYLYHQVVFLY